MQQADKYKMMLILLRLWIIDLRNRLPRYEEDDELRISERVRKNKSILVSCAEVDPNMFQQPSYNPFEMKYRNVNEFPLTDPLDKENIISNYANIVKAQRPYQYRTLPINPHETYTDHYPNMSIEPQWIPPPSVKDERMCMPDLRNMQT